MRRVLVLLAVLWVCEGVKFGQICEGNPSNTRRTSDVHGNGNYGARRQGGRTHDGVDVICSDGSVVYAPFDGTIRRKLVVYGDPAKAAIDQGLEMEGGGLRFKMFYVRPDKSSGAVTKGQRIGVMLPMQSVYPRITSHVHVELTNKRDPTPYF